MDTHTTLTGYRLHKLEVLNWGTFDGRIWTLEPHLHPSLLTGANGSGKSTLVDALLTLLVPSRARNYNQAAGASGKRERSEVSYVRGAYGKVQQEGDYTAKEQYLRDKSGYSVLLAVFGDGQNWVTAAQFFYFTESLSRFFVLADAPLSIAEHFNAVGDIRAFKKQLRGRKEVQLFEDFRGYSQQFRKRVNLRSTKALDLFNQTVTIKEIGSLNEFVRQHMLENPPIGEKIESLIENYDNLTQAHEAIEKATRQVNVLRPLISLADRYDKQVAEWVWLERVEAAVAPYFAGRKLLLLQAEEAHAQRDLAQHQRKLETAKTQLAEWRGRQTDLELSIRQDETGQRLTQIEQDLRYQRREETQRRKIATDYNSLALAFHLPEYKDEATFYAGRGRAEQEFRPVIKQRLEERQETLRQQQIAEETLKKAQKELAAELDSLRQRTSQIPAQNLRLRGRILDALGLAERDVPFVGELVRVREKEQKVWEGALERLLHGFGLSLLVPERHYQRFADYVRQNHLGGRLVFHRLAENGTYRPPAQEEPTAVYTKLRLKPDTPYKEWLEHELRRQFDHKCCLDTAEFGRASKAITPEGLVKGGRERHEKDDRHRVDDRSRYILGWDNKDKIRTLEQELAGVNQRLAEAQQAIAQAQGEVRLAYERQGQLESFLRFDDFAALDWRTVAAEIGRLEQEKTQLQRSSDKLQTLQDELTRVKAQIAAREQEKQQLLGDIGRLEYQIKQFVVEMAQCQADLRGVDEVAMKAYSAELTGRLTAEPTRATIDPLRRDLETKLRTEIRTKQNSLQGMSNNLTGQMRNYKNLFGIETADLDDSLDSLPAFRQELQRLEHDDLPQHEKRFRSLLNEKVTENIVILQSDLQKQQEEIDERIAGINLSLKSIPYTADTYIQLQTKPNTAAEIRAFKADLAACLPDVGQMGEAAYEASYQRVRPLIDKLKSDERWRRTVTDVRNWLDFSASERYRADDSERHYYSDSSGKSGGQKAKLAYTILASAIAYQYGLDTAEPQPDTFRFVVVDEAFSRSDEANSRYAMELFHTLGLQLLVVTPLTGIHVVEPYANVCHLVWNNNEGNFSQVSNMPMSELQRRRRSFR